MKKIKLSTESQQKTLENRRQSRLTKIYQDEGGNWWAQPDCPPGMLIEPHMIYRHNMKNSKR